MTLRHTLARPVERQGVGVHTGERARLRLAPAPWGTGLRYFAWGTERSVPASIAFAAPEPGATVLQRDGLRIGTPEHLLAALYACGVSDARIELQGPEVPILDGSALPWCEAIHQAGLRSGPRREVLVLGEAVRVELGEGWAEARPHPEPVVRVEVDFGRPGAPPGATEVTLTEETFLEDVAFARTFVLQADIARLREAGRGRGASAGNTVVYGPDGPTVPTRSFDEGVRHKLLDAIGDLALAGAPVLARIIVHKGSHALHQRLVAALVRQGVSGRGRPGSGSGG